MILTSTTEPVRYVPPWRTADDGPTYLIRAGSVRERGQVEAELAGPHRADRVYGYEMRAALRAGVETLLADDPELDRVLGLLESEEEPTGDDAVVLADSQKAIAEFYGPYRDLLAQQARRSEMAPYEAIRRFLVGIDGDIPFARDRDGMVAEATLAAIDPLELRAAGNFAYSLLYGGGQDRPLPQPSASDDGQGSSSPVPSKAAGSSAKKGGRKTPA